ncbi:MAG: S8 family serine peptidase [Candidatus Eiseniibacteriota bacterium]
MALLGVLAPVSLVQAQTHVRTFAEAASDPRVDPGLSAMLRSAQAGLPLSPGVLAGDDEGTGLNAMPEGVPVFIEGSVDEATLASLGISVETKAGDIVSARLPLGSVPALLDQPGFAGIRAAVQLEPMLNLSAREVDADDIWVSSPPTYTGYSGRNVVVGIVDTGIDLTHPDFKNSQNKTRVKYVWHQTYSGGTRPPGFTYGSEYTATQIDQGLAIQYDTDGHGTHIAGIAAGNGRATGNGFAAYRYVGIAPEADLIVVKSTLFETDVLNGVNYIFQRAASLGRPAVVLLAISGRRGGHDGSYDLDRSISALTGPGKVVVAAAGNYGGSNYHALVNLSNNQSTVVNFSIPTYNEITWDPEQVELEFWHEATSTYKVKLTSPRGYTSNWINPNAGSGIIITNDGPIEVRNDLTTSVKGGKLIHLAIYDDQMGKYPYPGTWRIDVQRMSGTQSSPLHGWVAYRRLPGNLEPVFTSGIQPGYLVGTPATGDSVIAVGGYTVKTQWTNVNGSTSSYVGAPPLQTIAPWSAPGPRRDGAQRPDITAPGFGVMAALSEQVRANTSNVWIAEDNVHRIRYGTSVAAAHVAGSVALLLQQTTNMSPSKARLTIIQRNRIDSNTGSVPNATWGHGKLDLMPGGSVGVGDGATISGIQMAPVFPNPAAGVAHFDFTLSSDAIAQSGGRVQLRILDVRGREVAVVPGSSVEGPQRLSWDGRANGGSLAAAGIYLGQLEVGTGRAVRKFVLAP